MVCWRARWQRTNYFDEGGTIPTYFIGISTANTRGLLSQQFPGGISASQLATANNLLASLAGFVSDASQVFNVTSRKSGYVAGAPKARHLPNNVMFFVDNQNINSADFGKISSTLNAPRFLQTVLRFTF